MSRPIIVADSERQLIMRWHVATSAQHTGTVNLQDSASQHAHKRSDHGLVTNGSARPVLGVGAAPASFDTDLAC